MVEAEIAENMVEVVANSVAAAGSIAVEHIAVAEVSTGVEVAGTEVAIAGIGVEVDGTGVVLVGIVAVEVVGGTAVEADIEVEVGTEVEVGRNTELEVARSIQFVGLVEELQVEQRLVVQLRVEAPCSLFRRSPISLPRR